MQSRKIIGRLALLIITSSPLSADQAVTTHKMNQPKLFQKVPDAEDKVDSNTHSISSNYNFPPFKFKDIPMLLKIGKSKKTQSPCPSNLLSSRHHANCSEGIAALWLIEGIRQGGKYPSLNAIILIDENKQPRFQPRESLPGLTDHC